VLYDAVGFNAMLIVDHLQLNRMVHR
jgi:hypothetical protein